MHDLVVDRAWRITDPLRLVLSALSHPAVGAHQPRPGLIIGNYVTGMGAARGAAALQEGTNVAALSSQYLPMIEWPIGYDAYVWRTIFGGPVVPDVK